MSCYGIIAEISSVNDYINFLFEYSEKKNVELWYRGQRDNTWSIDSSINRNKIMDIPKLESGEVATLKYKNIVDFKKEIDSFCDAMKGFVPSNFNKFHYMMLGQHYGLKTPALDWSTDPLVGLFFAIDGFEKENNNYPVVFVLDPSKLNANSMIVYKEGNLPITEPLNIDNLSNTTFDLWLSDLNNTPFAPVPFAIRSNLDISHRISRQSGVFTLMDTRQSLGYPWIQTVIDGEPLGITIKIKSDKVEEIRKQLEVLNIKSETIYGNDHKDWDEKCSEIISCTPII